MIDLAKERELFEEWCEYVQGLSTYMIGDEYEHRHTELSWLSWIASVSREGYKLVPLEPKQEVIDKFPEVLYQDTYAGECSMLVDDETIRLGYKAMIGAAP